MSGVSPEEVKSTFSFSIPIQVRLSDIDGYLHVNNGIYFNYLEHGRAIYLVKSCGWDVMNVGTVVANISIDYKRPIHAEDTVFVYVRCSSIGKSSFVLDQMIMGMTKAGDEAVFAESKTTMVAVDMQTMRPIPIPEAYVSKLRSS